MFVQNFTMLNSYTISYSGLKIMKAKINSKQQKNTPHSLQSMLNALFNQKNHIFDPNLKTLNTCRLASSRFAFSTIFSPETLKTSSAYRTLKQANGLTGGNWQKWKRVFLTCPCHKIYRDEAVGLKSCKNTWKITIGPICENVKFGATSWKFDISSITA